MDAEELESLWEMRLPSADFIGARRVKLSPRPNIRLQPYLRRRKECLLQNQRRIVNSDSTRW